MANGQKILTDRDEGVLSLRTSKLKACQQILRRHGELVSKLHVNVNAIVFTSSGL